MDRAHALRRIADAGYNVGFGAKKHFSTYDIVDKAPGWIGFFSLAVGVFALYIDVLATKHVSAVMIVLGIAGLIISTYSEEKQKYEQIGVQLTMLFNQLKTLYLSVKSSDKVDFSDEIDKLAKIEVEFSTNSLSKQIFLSDWYAHYKFFWQHQIDWIDEQKHLRFWRDKVPLSFSITIILLLVLIVALLYLKN